MHNSVLNQSLMAEPALDDIHNSIMLQADIHKTYESFRLRSGSGEKLRLSEWDMDDMSVGSGQE